MRKIIITEFISLDGVVEDPGGAEDFRHGGWRVKFEAPEGGVFKVQEIEEAEAQLLGRVTYEGFAAAWPEREGDFADKFNSMPKYVVSSTLESADWTNSHILRSLDEVRELRESDGGPLLVAGSIKLSQALLRADLVDQLNLMVFPVLLGAGRRLWGELDDLKTLELASAQTLGDGTIISVYTRP